MKRLIKLIGLRRKSVCLHPHAEEIKEGKGWKGINRERRDRKVEALCSFFILEEDTVR